MNDAERKMKSDIASVVNYFEESDLTDEELINLSKDIERISKQYAKEKCKEQRELCTYFIKPNYDPNNTGNWNVVNFDENLVKKIINAPEPKFD